MADYVVMHLYNVAPGAATRLEEAYTRRHLPSLDRLRGFRGMQRYRCAPQQLMPDIAQPWTQLSVYDFTLADPAIDLPALAPLLADLREAGLVAADDAERIYSYAMYAPWKFSANLTPGRSFTHLMFLLANFVPGREAEYHRWYDEVHSVEVSESPGYVGMRRGCLSPVQVPPVRFCPGDQLILGGIQTDDLERTLKEFRARAMGTSPLGVAWGPRSKAGSVARTVHLFESAAGPFPPSFVPG